MTPAPQGFPWLLAVDAHGRSATSWNAHRTRHGDPALPRLADLVAAVEEAGLTGRGGAAFPTARKLSAVAAAGRRPVVVANGAEGEPASSKDAVLLTHAPHLVLDGLVAVSRALGASRTVLYLHRGSQVEDAVRQAVVERPGGGPRIEIVLAPPRFLAGEESALVSRVEGKAALPRAKPPRVFERGVGGRPTLVQNVETLAHLALVARHGGSWFRRTGTAGEPGSALVTVSGAVRRPTVVETPLGARLDDVVAAAGGYSQPVQAVLFGGYHGAWLPATALTDLRISAADLRRRGALLGAGVIAVLPQGVCGVLETARVVAYLADESAQQCGPCLNGLPALATALAALAQPGRQRGAQAQVLRWTAMIERRGACHHPDGSARFIRSALVTFKAELDQHERGRCTARSTTPILPVGPAPRSLEDWS